MDQHHEQSNPMPSASPVPTQPLFYGRFGLRAAWGIAIFSAFYVILVAIAGTFGYLASGHMKEIIAAGHEAAVHPQAPKPHLDVPFVPALVIVNDGVIFVGMWFLCWFFAKAERRQLHVYGIGHRRISDLLPGAFWGLFALSVLVLILHACHLLSFDGLILHGLAIPLYALKWLLAFLLVGFAEEYFFRGYVQFTLTRGLFGLAAKFSATKTQAVAFWIAAMLMSVLFGAMHLLNPGENTLGVFQVVLVGIVFSYALWRTGSLWWGIGFHMAWDWAQSFLYGVPDSGNLSVGRLFQTHVSGKPLLSGGVDGPEGSVLCVPVLLLVIVIIRFTTKPGQQPALEQDPLPDHPANLIFGAPIA